MGREEKTGKWRERRANGRNEQMEEMTVKQEKGRKDGKKKGREGK